MLWTKLTASRKLVILELYGVMDTMTVFGTVGSELLVGAAGRCRSSPYRVTKRSN